MNDSVAGWVDAMAGQITNYYRFRSESFTCYKMYFNFNSADGNYYLAAERLRGDPPADGNSGEIIVELDWSQLADGNSYNTYQIAEAVVPALMDTNFIPDLGGHALAEFPLHLIGHSRGGSLMSEISHELGTNGVWVDQLTTLDPHPLNNDGFTLDAILYSAVDAPVRTYENVLFHDNDYQTLNLIAYGEPVAGAYIRQLTQLDGGYDYSTSLAPSHSDVHLWYFGTIDLATPASYVEGGSTISIDSTMRGTWWSAYEDQGALAGFHYSLIGGGNRLSTDQPLGPGYPEIRDGFNQWWDLGAGVTNNRTVLSADHGGWPNLIRFDRVTTNEVVQGQSTPLKFYYQWAQPDTNFATVSIYLDDDLNPLNTNQTFLQQIVVPGNGASYVSYMTTNITLSATNATPGEHALFATITGGSRTRYLYAPELVQVLAAGQPLTLDVAPLSATQLSIGINGQPGQTTVLETSTDLQNWTPLATNTLAGSRWTYTNSIPSNEGQRFYRAMAP